MSMWSSQCVHVRHVGTLGAGAAGAGDGWTVWRRPCRPPAPAGSLHPGSRGPVTRVFLRSDLAPLTTLRT